MEGIVQKDVEVEVFDDESVRSKGSKTNDSKKKPKQGRIATFGETFSFVLESGGNTKLLLFIGTIAAALNGLTYPLLAFVFTRIFSDLLSSGLDGMGNESLKKIAFSLLGLGAYAQIFATLQVWCYGTVAHRGGETMRKKWFQALLRQDQAFFDVYDASGIANSVNPAATKYRRGVGRKFSEGVEFFVCGIGGLVYALVEEWRTALVVLTCSPVVAYLGMVTVELNQTRTVRASKAYSEASSVAYSAVSGIKTVLSLNAAPKMINNYQEATLNAFSNATKELVKEGFVNGAMLGSFMFMYMIVILFGMHLVSQQVEETGCDPSGAIPNNETCGPSGLSVFGALLGVAFAGQGISQVGAALQAFGQARACAGQAITAVNRKPGQPEEKIYHDEEEKNDDDESVTSISRHSNASSQMIETPEGRIKAILPAYEINSMSDEGLKPEEVDGRLAFEGVEFRYPTRPAQTVLNGLTIDIPAGTTIAFVGPSGGGKSTVVKLLERFYDPIGGSVKLDGTDIKDINVKHLRSMIGYVGQEPALFATTIGQNIAYGHPDCTQKQIEDAAKQANAHDFIMQLPDGYKTDVGDRGSQLSGGQKQRIAIARVLIGDPKILLLDEATSALDTQSELVVQEALENIISTQKRTTVIVAHRLSTIRNADIIAVVMGGTIVETGKHDELMNSESYYKKLVQTQGKDAMAQRKSSVAAPDAFGKTESQRGFEKVPDSIVDKDATPLIVFKNVNFTYPSRPDKLILDKFKLKIYKGETIGLCGISGGGKSTVMGLIERFYDPDNGSVEYHGKSLKDLNVKWYRDQIGYVGQEPTLFDATIAENIAYGSPEASREQIMEAAKQANAYDFIMNFPDGFDTPLTGGAGTELSGGQKQRVAIARALVKQPQVLLLDEATSALDNESERIVQEALDKLMESRERTYIVIAHRLSTIRNADRIAFIGDGRLKEIGSHDELMEKSNGKYKRLVEAQGRGASTVTGGLGSPSKKKSKKGSRKGDGEENLDGEIEKEESTSFDLGRARRLARPDVFYLIIGSLGALLAGVVFPGWGFLFADLIEIMYRPVFNCSDPDSQSFLNLTTCDGYNEREAQSLRDDSYTSSIYWTVLIVFSGVGNTLMFWGFGQASERMSKRVRDNAFTSLLRQEVAYFDKRSVGNMTSELEEDAAHIQTFTGQPIRSFILAMSSISIGVVCSFFYGWPIALIAIACLPVMGWAQSLEMEKTMGKDEGDVEKEVLENSSPGGIVVETLLNIGTVSALSLEENRFIIFQEALNSSNDHYARKAFREGFLAGLSMLTQMLVYALMFWAGGYIAGKYPKTMDINGMNKAIFMILFSLFALGIAFQDMADRKEVEKGASRIFHLLDRKSEIDPLSDEGATVDYSVQLESKKKKKSEKKKKLKSSLKNLAEEDPEIVEVDGSDIVEDPGTEKRKSSKKKNKKSKKNLNEADDGDDGEKKPKSKKKKKKKSKKEDSLPNGEPDEILFAPESDTQEDDGEKEAGIAVRIAALEEKTKDVEPPKPMDSDQLF